MAERKVLIKYYPPDFNPAKLIKNKRPIDKQDNVRMMLPMTVRCNTCGNYLSIGTKFNMRKETVLNENYLGIRIYRFYLKCTHCYTEITFKTDPKNHDYVLEYGATRNYEASRDNEKAQEVLKTLRDNDEEGNAMRFLENRTMDSKRELQILDALDEIRHNSKKTLYLTPEELIKKMVEQQIKNDIYEELDEQETQQLEQFKENAKFKRLIDDEDNNQQQQNNFNVNMGNKEEENRKGKNKNEKQAFQHKIKKIQKISEKQEKNIPQKKQVVNYSSEDDSN